jgi:hypothetical protein
MASEDHSLLAADDLAEGHDLGFRAVWRLNTTLPRVFPFAESVGRPENPATC